MAKKIIQDLSANTLQVGINQVCGLLIFYVLSLQLDKSDFGSINWCLALLLAIFGMLSFGIDQVLVRKIASADKAKESFAAFTYHVMITGLSFYALICIFCFFYPQYDEARMLLWLGAGKLCLFFASPVKQLANGLERFRILLWMNTCSNIIRTILLLVLSYNGQVTVRNTVIIFVIADIAETLLSLLLARWRLQSPRHFVWEKKYYPQLLKEALPQLGVVIFSSILARIDWILIGILASNTILANYSFAYKVFEVSTLPLLIIAPLLIPRFSRRFQQGDKDDPASLVLLLRSEMLIAGFTVLMLNLLWTPVIDGLTGGRYGAVNSTVIILLSACIPFQYLNNFLWTMHFTQGRLPMIFRVFAVCLVVNVAGNAIGIPWMKAEGAAAVYLLTMIVQSFLFLQQTRNATLRSSGYACLLCPLIALAAAYTGMWATSFLFLSVITGIVCYVLLLWLSRQFGLQDIRAIKKLAGWPVQAT